MKAFCAILIVTAACAGCAVSTESTQPTESPQAPAAARATIEQADTQLASADYAGARDAYAKFAVANPDAREAARARAMQVTLNRLLTSQSELDTAKRTNETPRLQRELAEQKNEVERLRAEVAKLRSDLERLRSIDLKTLPAGKK